MITKEQAIKLLQSLPANVKVELNIRTGVDTGTELLNYDDNTGVVESHKKLVLSLPSQQKVAYAIHKANNIPLPNNGNTSVMTKSQLQEWIDENNNQ